MATPFLEIKGLNAWYGESHVLHGVDFHVDEGEVVTLLGRNGAGRTSTLRAIMGLTGSRKGSIKVRGVETVGMSTHRIARLGIGYCPEERGIFSSLTAEENLMLPPVLAPGGMGHEDIDRIAALIRRVSANRTILMVEHNLQVVANLSHCITVLTRGRVLAEGDYRTVSENPEVREAYMGAGHG